MATHPVLPFQRLHQPELSGGYLSRYAPGWTASQTFLGGALIVTDATTAALQEGDTPYNSTNADLIVGVATSDWAGYSWQVDTFLRVTQSVPVAKAGGKLFIGTLADSATPGPAIADISVVPGNQYALVVDSVTGLWVVDQPTTANPVVEIVDIISQIGGITVADGDINVPVVFKFLDAEVSALGW